MGKKGPLTIVSPDDFRERTARALRHRSDMLQAVDQAYVNYYHLRVPAYAQDLHAALGAYMRAHGGSWARCERNVASGGLMEYVFNAVGPNAPSPDQARAIDLRAAARIRDIEIPSARFGVLYFLSGIRIDLDLVDSSIRGAGAIGGSLAVGLSTDFRQVASAVKGTRAVTSVAGKGVRAQDIATGGTGALRLGHKLTGSKSRVSGGRPSVPGASWLPRTEAALNAMSRTLHDHWDPKQYGDALAYAGAGLPPSPTEPRSLELVAALTGDALLAVTRLAEAAWRKVRAAVDKVCAQIKLAWASRHDLSTARRLGEILKKASVVAINYIMNNAIPYLGGAIDLGTGLSRTIREAGTRLAAWNDRPHIRLRPGHPEELVRTIEHQMSLGILGGVGDMLKGASKLAASAFLPGLSALVSAVMGGIEWLVRLVWRLGEYFGIQNFLQTARRHYETEKRRAREVDGIQQPNTEGGGIITDTAAFTRFFREGCEASPLIPMLVLNSGLGGSLMTTLELFEDDGSQSARATPDLGGGETREFDRGAVHLARLKRWSLEYMRKSGFKFRPADAQDTLMSGYLAHATRTGKERVVSVRSRLGALLTG